MKQCSILRIFTLNMIYAFVALVIWIYFVCDLKKKTIKVNKEYGETKKGLHITVRCFILAIYQHCILNLARILSQLLE